MENFILIALTVGHESLSVSQRLLQETGRRKHGRNVWQARTMAGWLRELCECFGEILCRQQIRVMFERRIQNQNEDVLVPLFRFCSLWSG